MHACGGPYRSVLAYATRDRARQGCKNKITAIEHQGEIRFYLKKGEKLVDGEEMFLSYGNAYPWNAKAKDGYPRIPAPGARGGAPARPRVPQGRGRSASPPPPRSRSPVATKRTSNKRN
jgi:hypothetical protein